MPNHEREPRAQLLFHCNWARGSRPLSAIPPYSKKWGSDSISFIPVSSVGSQIMTMCSVRSHSTRGLGLLILLLPYNSIDIFSSWHSHSMFMYHNFTERWSQPVPVPLFHRKMLLLRWNSVPAENTIVLDQLLCSPLSQLSVHLAELQSPLHLEYLFRQSSFLVSRLRQFEPHLCSQVAMRFKSPFAADSLKLSTHPGTIGSCDDSTTERPQNAAIPSYNISSTSISVPYPAATGVHWNRTGAALATVSDGDFNTIVTWRCVFRNMRTRSSLPT